MTLRQILNDWENGKYGLQLRARRPHWFNTSIDIHPGSRGAWRGILLFDGNAVYQGGDWRPSIMDAIADDWEVVE